MAEPHSVSRAHLKALANRTTDWLCGTAAPLWSANGRTDSGLFPERISLSGESEDSYFRVFVQARHIYSFCTLGELGWRGPWQTLVHETTETLLDRARRPDGLFVHKLNVDASPQDHRADLYDQSFVMLAFGTAGAALALPKYFDAAELLLDVIEAKWLHPLGGFTEGEIVDPRVRRQNPHMHLFEASLALFEASGRERFLVLAESIARLAVERLIDPVTGALLEYFDDALNPAEGIEGRIVEPGHCFEWAWLFERLAGMGWREGSSVSDRLVGFARSTGIDHDRGVVINEVLTDGAIHDANARLWPQTERIKAAVARFRRTNDESEASEAASAVAGLELYFNVATPGLWRDKLRPNGEWLEELAPGSSLYHIACAYRELVANVP